MDGLELGTHGEKLFWSHRESMPIRIPVAFDSSMGIAYLGVRH